MKKLLSLTLLAMLAASLQAAPVAPAPAAKKLEHVKLGMNWIPYTDYAMYVYGIGKGVYRDAGIDVELIPAKGSELCIKLVGGGSADFGSASADELLLARTKGMPVKALAVMQQSSPVSVISLAKLGIKKPKDLEGKRLASDPSSMKHRQFEAFCKLNGVDLAKITVLPIKGSNFMYLLEGKADAMLAFDYIGDAQLRQKGHEIDELKLRDHGVDIYSLSLFTTDALIKADPALVKRFAAATRKSWELAMKDPAAAAEALAKAYPELPLADNLPQVQGVVALMRSPDTKTHGVGYQSQEKWTKTQNLLFDLGMVEKKLDLKDVYTSKF